MAVRFRLDMLVGSTLVAMTLASACSSSATEPASKDQTASAGAGSGIASGDGAEIEVPVPMGLLDPVALARERKLVGGTVASDAVACLAAPPETDDAPLALERQIIDAPARATAQALCLVVEVESLLAELLGADQGFGARGVAAPEQGFRLYQLGAAANGEERVARVSLQAPSALRFRIEILQRGIDAWRPSVDVAFAPYDQGAKVEIATYAPGRFVRVAYDTGAHVLSTALLVDAVTFASTPQATVIELEWDESGISTAGAYAWRELAAATDANLPRYHPRRLRTGDVETFRLRATVDGAAIVQETYFTPIEAPSPVSHAALADAALLAMVRDPTLHSGCDRYGAAMKAAFTDPQRPAAVAALPDAVCVGETPSDAAVIAGVTAACALLVELPAANGQAICAASESAILLGNPQRFVFEDGARVFAVPPHEPSAVHARLESELAAIALSATGAERLGAVYAAPSPVADVELAHARR